MKMDFKILSQCPLFHGMYHTDLEQTLQFLNGKTNTYSKGNSIFLKGSSAGLVGIVLSGKVQIVREDYYGNRSVLTVLKIGELFGEVFPCAGLKTMPVSAIALQTSDVLLLDCRKIFTSHSDSFGFHNQLITNLLQEIARKNLDLNKKIRYMSQKTTKEKVITYLLDEAKQNNCSEFTIPYDRQALADYLGVERSAMSAEIGKLKKKGVIDTKGSWFSIQNIEKA